MEQENILGKEKIGKLILKFSIPCIVSMLVNSLYNIVDQIFIGQGVGTLGNGATNVVFPLVMIGLAFSLMFGDGASAYLSLKLGEKKKKEAEKGIGNGILLSAIVSIIFCVITLIFLPQLLTLFGCTDKLRDLAMTYGRIIAIGFPFSMIGTTLNSIIRADGNPKYAMTSMVTGAILNTILDPIFIFVFHKGVAGAAIATVFSQAVSMILCMIHLMKKGTIYQVELKKLHIDREMLGQIIRYGLPSGVQNSVIGFANVIVQSNINSFGKVAMAAYGAYSKLEGFAFLPVTSFTMALTTFVGQNLGAGLHDRAKKGSRFGIIASVVIAEIIGVTMYLLAPQLVALFSPTPEVVELGARQMRTTALFFCLLAYSHAIASICRGAGKAFVPMVIMLLFWCVVRIAYITIVINAHVSFGSQPQ